MAGRRRTHCSLIAALAALTLGACRDKTPEGTALIGATVIDGSGGTPLPDAVIVVRGTHIESITPREGFEIPKNTRKVDVSGTWIIPGLIDAHAHVAPWALPRYLAWGVTTVRDVHGTLDTIIRLRERASLNALPGPRIFSAGAMIDGTPTTYPDALAAENAGTARQAVDRLAVAGVDYVKVYTRVDPTMLRAIADEAKTFHLRITAHLGLTDALTAAGIGVTSIEHMSGVPEAASGNASEFYAAHRRGFFAGWTYFERSWAGLDSAALARVAGGLAERRVTLVPTLVLHETFSRLDDSALYRNPALADVPAAQRAAWNVPDMIQRAGWTAADFAAFRQSRARQDLFIREFRAAGGLVAAGTDATNQMLIPGYSEHEEMALLVNAGLTPIAALRTATGDAAHLLNADSLGVLAAGRVADLVILRADPLADIRNTRAIDRVMLRGALMRADSIRKAW
ncbi:MAG: amidohydrolase family protein [Gemmatimonadales bacterium]|nr:amidohydrolase family protein [Gemmatimonadales bacterium]